MYSLRRLRLAFSLNFVSLQTFLALYRNEGNFLAFFQALEAITLNRPEVYEQIRPALRSDKTKTFFVVEPLAGTALTFSHFLISFDA